MSTAMSTVREFAGNEKDILENAPAARAASEAYYMSAHARKVVYLSLVVGFFFLASVAAYVWYGFYQWQKIW